MNQHTAYRATTCNYNLEFYPWPLDQSLISISISTLVAQVPSPKFTKQARESLQKSLYEWLRAFMLCDCSDMCSYGAAAPGLPKQKLPIAPRTGAAEVCLLTFSMRS